MRVVGVRKHKIPIWGYGPHQRILISSICKSLLFANRKSRMCCIYSWGHTLHKVCNQSWRNPLPPNQPHAHYNNRLFQFIFVCTAESTTAVNTTTWTLKPNTLPHLITYYHFLVPLIITDFILLLLFIIFTYGVTYFDLFFTSLFLLIFIYLILYFCILCGCWGTKHKNSNCVSNK